jgi:hypothetical protein
MNDMQLYLELQKAIEEADSIPPCQVSDPEAWYPETHIERKTSSSKIAKQMCNSCPVITQCLTYALQAEERFGVWGGLNADERAKMISARRRLTTSLQR